MRRHPSSHGGYLLQQHVVISVPHGGCIHQRAISSCSTAVVFSSNASSFQSFVLLPVISYSHGSVSWRLFHRLILSKMSSVLQCVTCSDPGPRFRPRSTVLDSLPSSFNHNLFSLFHLRTSFAPPAFHTSLPSQSLGTFWISLWSSSGFLQAQAGHHKVVFHS